jgi:hypothetical protein
MICRPAAELDPRPIEPEPIFSVMPETDRFHGKAIPLAFHSSPSWGHRIDPRMTFGHLSISFFIIHASK